jgi:hypothetical protein
MAKPEQCIFAYQAAETQPDGIPVLVFLMPQAAWDYMQGGMGHDFDLTNVGIPLKVLIGRCETRESGIAMLRKTGLIDDRTKDAQHVDLAFGDRKPRQ